MTLPSGVPLATDYSELMGSPDFGQMESFSDDFLQRHSDALSDYARKWVADPLHQWSRQWEYPFVASRVGEFLSGAVASDSGGPTSPRILDAGSGVTFFPYLLASRSQGLELHCCDLDASLGSIFDAVNAEETIPAHFHPVPLNDTGFPDEHFHLVYCISVLEHTENYGDILRELRRILKPGGSLLVTFDVSMDGIGEIPVEGAVDLLETIESVMGSVDAGTEALRGALETGHRLTTLSVAKERPELIPWRRPSWKEHLASLLRLQGTVPWPREATIFCLEARRSE